MSWYIATESVWGFFFCPLLNIAQYRCCFKIGLNIFSRIHRKVCNEDSSHFLVGYTVTTFPGGYIHRCWNSFSFFFFSSQIESVLFCLFIFVSVGRWRLDPWPHFSCPFRPSVDVRRQRSARDRKRERIVSLFRFHLHRNLAKDDFTWPYRETHTDKSQKENWNSNAIPRRLNGKKKTFFFERRLSTNMARDSNNRRMCVLDILCVC